MGTVGFLSTTHSDSEAGDMVNWNGILRVAGQASVEKVKYFRCPFGLLQNWNSVGSAYGRCVRIQRRVF